MDDKNKAHYLYEMFNLVTDFSGTGVCVIDANTRELYFCNHAAFFLTDGKTIQYQGLTCHKVFFDRDQPCKNCPLELAKLGKEEHDIHMKEQGKRYEVKSQILHWDGREVAVIFLTDISHDTKRLEALKKEKAIKKNDFDLAKTKMVNDSDLISYIIYDLTKDRFVGTATGKYCDLTKYRDCSALSFFAQEMSKIILDDQKRSDFIAAHDIGKLLKKHFTGEKDTQFDVEVVLASGQERWERIELLTAENPENGSVYLFEYAYDIHKEKNVEIMMNFAVNDEYDLIGNVNLRTGDCVLMYGQNSFNALGKSVVEDNYDVSLERFIQAGVRDDYQQTYRKLASLETVAKHLQQQSVYEIIIYTKYNHQFRVKRDRYSLCGPKSEYCVFTQTDITDVLAAEEQKRKELQKALNAANAATKAKSVFLSRMSHEIRTPLNAIIGINELVQDDLNKGKLEINTFIEHNNDISSASKYLLSVLNDILDTTKIESGKMKINAHPVNTEQFIDSIHALAKSLAEEREIEFTLRRSGAAQAQYQFDGMHVQQVVMNLLGNAFKFTSPGGHVSLEVKILDEEQTHTTVQFVVSDDGIGMSKAFQKEMFESFTQEHTEHTSKYGGSGLGLNLVKELVKMMHGSIACESVQGEGTTFTVTLAVENIAENESTDQSGITSQNVDSLDFKGLHILLCEDHPMNQKITKMSLERKNAIVDIAGDGEIGLRTFSESALGDYQLILMDIRMPHMDGIETAKKIRALPRQDAKSIPIIALSANAYEEDIQESKEAGMNAHLSKPIEPKLLFSTILKLLQP